MKTTLYRASSRGHAYFGWLDAYHTFSFANYYDPARIHFGALRVMNDDIIQGGKGFDTHPHNNMEIVTIPLYGSIAHKDSLGNSQVVRKGEIQVMSAGSGISHSEFNANEEEPVNLFQIWIFPDKKNVEPRYDQKEFDFDKAKNKLVQIVGPKDDMDSSSLWIHQSTWFNIGEFDAGQSIDYKIKQRKNGLFAMVIEGEFSIEGQKLNHRDGLGIWDVDNINIKADSEDARILLIEVPMVL